MEDPIVTGNVLRSIRSSPQLSCGWTAVAAEQLVIVVHRTAA
jgi:hypothetical protein